MKKRILSILVVMALVFVLVAACADDTAPAATPAPDQPAVEAEATPEPDAGDDDPGDAPVVDAPEETVQNTLTVLHPSLAVHMRPWGQNDSASANARKQIFDTLITLDYITFQPVPELSLAASWEVVDPRTTNFTLREGVMFHNGEIMTAYDVQFSLMQSAQAGGVEILSGMIEEVVVHDDLNFTVITEFDFVPILSHLSHTSLGIVPMDYFLEVGEDGFEEHPIGSGPFMFYNWIVGERIDFVRNENFWGHVPVIEYLSFVLVADASVRLMEVMAGNADVATDVLPGEIQLAQDSPDVTLMRRQNLSTAYVGFNVERPHINNPLVRQAINYALDTHAIVDHVFMGLGQVQDGPMPNLVWGYSPQPPFPTDLDRARELLIEAGYNPTPGEPGGFSTSIWWNIPNAQREQISEMIQFTLAQLNIEVEIVGMEWAQYLEDTGYGLHDMFILGWVSITGDPDYSLFPLFHSSNFGDAGNRTFWYEPRLDELLDMGRSTVDPAERLAIYEEAQALIRENAPWVFLHNGEWAFAVANNLNGFVLNPAGHHSYAPAWFD